MTPRNLFFALLLCLFCFSFALTGCRRPGLYVPRPPRAYVPVPPSPRSLPPAARASKKMLPPWAPAHGRRAKYQYRYYPGGQVYYEPGKKVYFYMHDGDWLRVRVLPPFVRINRDDFVLMDMDVDRPYKFHRDITGKYPPGQLKKNKKKGKGHKKKKGKGHWK